MKKSILVLVVLVWSSVFLYSIEPPVDVLELDYDKMINSGEGQLSGDHASFPGTVKYLGEEISYSSNLNLDDNKERFLFFSRDNVDKDTFYEYCREIIRHYIKESTFFRVDSSFALRRDNEYITAQNFYFFIKDKPVINVYINNGHDDGVYGFGIQPQKNDYIFRNEPLQQVDLLTGNTIYSTEDFDFNEFYDYTTIFVDPKEFVHDLETPITNESPGHLNEDKSEITIGKTVLLPGTIDWEEIYNISIATQNLDGIKRVYFISNNYNSIVHVYVGNEIVNKGNQYSVYSNIDKLILFEKLPYNFSIGSTYSNSAITVIFVYSAETKEKSPNFTIDIDVVESEE